jgi:hypothetical protein
MIEKTIKEAVFYAKSHLDLREEDEDYFTNLLLAHYHKAQPYEGEIDEKAISAYPLPDPIVNATSSKKTSKTAWMKAKRSAIAAM